MKIDEEKLIEEIKKRRPLWDTHLKSYQSRELKCRLWKEVAECLGTNGEAAKKKFKNMKDIFRRELRRGPSKKKQRSDSLNSSTSEMDSASTISSSKWRLFDDMVFLKDCLDVRAPSGRKVPTEDSGTDLDNMDSEFSDSIADSFATFDDLRSELFSPPITNQIITTTLPNPPPTNITCPPKRKISLIGKTDCKKVKSIDLESLAQLLNSENEKNYQDDDYNFLISFYPYLKRMPELTKLQFRVRMQELLYNTMAEIEAANSLSNALQVQIAYPNNVEVVEESASNNSP